MNLNKENGITIIALIITIILMLILAGVGMHFGSDAVSKAKIEDIKEKMISINIRAKIIAEKHNAKEIENLVGTKFEDATGFNKNNLNSVFSGFTGEQKDSLYIWTQEDLNNQGLNTIKVDTDNFYVINYNMDDFEIYYSKGIEGKFSLSELNVE